MGEIVRFPARRVGRPEKVDQVDLLMEAQARLHEVRMRELVRAWNAVATDCPTFDAMGCVMRAADLVKTAELELRRASGAIEAARKAAWEGVS